MAEEATTDQPQDAAGAEDAQPASTGDDTAVKPDANQGDQPASAPSQDENAEWLKSKGIEDPSSPEGQAALIKNAREAEQKMTQTLQASKLEQSLNQPPAVQQSEVQQGVDYARLAYEQAVAQRRFQEFEQRNPDWRDYDNQMAEWLEGEIDTLDGRFSRQALVNEGLMSLDEVLAIAKATDANRDNRLRNEGAKQTLETVANKSKTNSVSGAASSPSLEDKPTDDIMAGLTRDD